MFNDAKTQKSILTIKSKKNVSKMLGLSKKVNGTETSKNELRHVVKSRRRSHGLRSKHILKKYSSKRIPIKIRSTENEEGKTRVKIARKIKPRNDAKLSAAEWRPFQRNFVFPCSEDSFHFHRQHQGERSSKVVSNARIPEAGKAGDTNSMIFVSLDFLEDCHKYKKKFLKPASGVLTKTGRKSSETISKRHSNQRKGTQSPRKDEKTYKRVRRESSSEMKTVRSTPNDAEENRRKTKTNSPPAEEEKQVAPKNENPHNEALIEKSLSQSDNVSTATYLIGQSSSVKTTSEDVSTVDKKYIEFLLSIANCNEKKQKTNVNKHEIKAVDSGSKQPKKKVISGKTFFESKINKEKEEKALHETKEKEHVSEAPKSPVEKSNVSKDPQKNMIFSRLVRDLTKSEVHIKRKKKKNACGEKLTETQSQKKTAHSKPEVNDNRKKRKTRNNVLKKPNEETSELPSPRDILNTAEVQELWRRGTRKKSEISLSSQSATTVQQPDKIPKNKTSELESYQLLRKIVEAEIKTICKKFVNDKNEIRKINLNNNENGKMECGEETSELKNMCKDLKGIITENEKKILEKREDKGDVEVKSSKRNLLLSYDNPKKRNSLLSFIDKYDSKNIDPIFLEKKLPSEVVKNWSVLRRLEKAFLALGTPTFSNSTVKESPVIKTTDSNYKKAELPAKMASNIQANKKAKDSPSKKDSKTSTVSTRYLRAPKTPKAPSQALSSKISSTKAPLQSLRNERAKIEAKDLAKKKKPQVAPLKFGRLPEPALINPQKSCEGDNKLKLAKATSQNRKINAADAKITPKSTAKTKTREFELRYAKRNLRQKNSKPQIAQKASTPENKSPRDEKDEKSSQERTLETLTEDVKNEKPNEEENLERKETYVLPLENSFINQPQKSESFQKILTNSIKSDEIVESSDIDTSDILKIISDAEKKDNNADANTNSVNSSESSSADNAPLQPEKPVIANEENCSKQESSVISAPNLTPEVKKTVKETSQESQTPPPVEKSAVIERDRIIKERSILSMRNDVMQRTSLSQIPEETQLQLTSPLENVSKYQPKATDAAPDVVPDNTPDSVSYSCASTSTFDIDDFQIQNKFSKAASKMEFKSLRSMKCLDQPKESSSLVSMISISNLEQQPSPTEKQIETPGITDNKTVKNQRMWEQDIKQYRAIVEDIMNHYKRIDGLLKENEHSRILTHKSIINFEKKDKENAELSENSKNLLEMNIHEYRKKILSEYESLSIFEYKKRMLEQESKKKAKEKRRNLKFVKALETEMDLDVKDFQPNIQKILDSQLYVDTQSLNKRKKPCAKVLQKKASLQEIILNENQQLMTEGCPRFSFAPKNSLPLTKAGGSIQSTTALNVANSVPSDVGIQTLLLKI